MPSSQEETNPSDSLNALDTRRYSAYAIRRGCVWAPPTNPCTRCNEHLMTTRRDFLTQVGRAGGFGATYLIMQSLGLLPIPPSEASVLRLPQTLGKGKSVVIL
jgi:hypothetical protein